MLKITKQTENELQKTLHKYRTSLIYKKILNKSVMTQEQAQRIQNKINNIGKLLIKLGL